MTPLRIKLGLSVPLLALAFLCGCPQKKPQAAAPVPPPEASPTPVAEAPASQPEPTAQPPAQPPDQTEQAATEKQPEKKPVHKRRPVKKTTQEKAAVQEAKNTVPPRPDAAAQPSPPTISPVPAVAAPGHDQAAIEQLLQTAQNNLNNIKRELSQEQKDMVTQIQAFIVKSREATKNNDQVQAYTLANKARLLSDALMKQ
jgi:hypothetical protein